MSLGVDLVPKKVCSLDCVYCEVGQTTKLTTDRLEYIKLNKVKDELDHYFNNNPDPDYITFSGSGEPALNLYIGDVLDFIKSKRPAIPIAVLTNGTMFYDSDVRNALMKADVVLPSLDAATEEVFRKINRPHGTLNIKKYIDGLINFCSDFKGKIWLEVFILPGYNNNRRELDELKKVIMQIQPDSIQLNTLDRPGTVPGLVGATGEELQEVADYWKLDNVEIIASAPARKKLKSFRKDIETAILETISRRPCTLDDLTRILGLHTNEVNKYLDTLENEHKIESVRQERGFFYRIK